MSDVIIVAIITGVCSVIGQWLITRQQNKQRSKDEAVAQALLESRLKSVEKKLDEHNSYASRFHEIGVDIAVIKNELQNLRKEA